MYTCMYHRVTLLYSRKLTEHCKPAIMEKMKIIIKKEKEKKTLKVLLRKNITYKGIIAVWAGSSSHGTVVNESD